MAKTNNKGRTKNEQHIRLHRGLTNSDAWQKLSCEARALLIDIWTRHNGTNNGRISYSVREAKSQLHIGTRKAQRAFAELQEAGFLVCRLKGHFDCKVRHATEWEITDEAIDGQPARKLYGPWRRKKTGPTVGTDGTHCRNRGAVI